MIIVGVDPDSAAHGFAIYRNGKLSELRNMTLMEAHYWLEAKDVEGEFPALFSIENVLANNFVFRRNAGISKAEHADRARNVGRCQQAQLELMRLLDHWGVPYVLHKPTKNNWQKGRKTTQKERESGLLAFRTATGWQGRSNENTRSAAYFGFLAVKEAI